MNNNRLPRVKDSLNNKSLSMNRKYLILKMYFDATLFIQNIKFGDRVRLYKIAMI